MRFSPTGDLYNGAFRKAVLIMMSVVLSLNIVATGVCMAAAIAMCVSWQYGSEYYYRDYYYSSNPAVKAGIFFYWCTGPLIISSYSLYELIQFLRRRIRPLQMVITSSIITFLWILGMSFFGGCVYSHWEWQRYVTSICPVPRRYANALDYNWRQPQSYVPIVIIAPLLAYAVYLYFCVLALKRWRAVQHHNFSKRSSDLSAAERTWPTPEPPMAMQHHCQGCNCHAKYIPTQVLESKEYDVDHSTLASGASSPTFVDNSRPQRFTSMKSMNSGHRTVQSFSTVMTPRETEPPSYRNSAVLYQEIERPHGKR